MFHLGPVRLKYVRTLVDAGCEGHLSTADFLFHPEKHCPCFSEMRRLPVRVCLAELGLKQLVVGRLKCTFLATVESCQPGALEGFRTAVSGHFGWSWQLHRPLSYLFDPLEKQSVGFFDLGVPLFLQQVFLLFVESTLVVVIVLSVHHLA